MKIGLFIPCYIDQFYPKVGIATLELLEKLGVQVHYPLSQTCCGQPMANSGFAHLTKGCDDNFIQNFGSFGTQHFDYVVSPSGSCVLHIKEHLGGNPLHSDAYPEQVTSLKNKVFELCEFLTDILKVENLNAHFPHRVGFHNSCHGQRMLGLSSMSEKVGETFSKPLSLLGQVNGLTLADLSRKDECCGFGGTFCVTEEAVSVKMGKDRIADHLSKNVDFITGGDMSCLMHLEGILKRQKSTVKIIHIAEILNSK
ncbi:MAG: (Fe-S)-binding protein [Cytophagales bacterium]|nr:MAG: (Fe-S)-binding protein [Cytophagales bacterium]